MARFKLLEKDENKHEFTSLSVLNTLESADDVEFIIHLDEIMNRRGLSQRDVAKITGLRVGTVNSIINNKGISLNKTQLVALMVGLRITKLSELIEIKFSPDVEKQFQTEAFLWDFEGAVPPSVKELAIQNSIIGVSQKLQKIKKEDIQMDPIELQLDKEIATKKVNIQYHKEKMTESNDIEVLHNLLNNIEYQEKELKALLKKKAELRKK